jgi:hypothetical protein
MLESQLKINLLRMTIERNVLLLNAINYKYLILAIFKRV